MPVNDNVKDIRKVITLALRELDANSTDSALAMAQLLGIIAGKLDKLEGYKPFDERWAAITEVAREEYHKVEIDVRRPILVEEGFEAFRH